MICRALPLIAGLAFAASASAQCTPDPNTFCITFTGFYAVNGTAQQPLTLVRGQTYTFQMVGTPSLHPLHITTSATGGNFGAGHWSNGVIPSAGGVFGTQKLTFTVPTNAPDTLYYQCSVHAGLGAKITVVNPPCPSDFNGDGFTDIFDFNDFVDCFDSGTCPPGKSADFNNDGFADIFDFNDFVAAFETGC